MANDECLKLHVQEVTWTPPTLDMKEITLKIQALQSADQNVVSRKMDFNILYIWKGVEVCVCVCVCGTLSPFSLCVYIIK